MNYYSSGVTVGVGVGVTVGLGVGLGDGGLVLKSKIRYSSGSVTLVYSGSPLTLVILTEKNSTSSDSES